MRGLIDTYAQERLRLLTPDRCRTSLLVLGDFADWLEARSRRPNAVAVRDFLTERVQRGQHPGTVRKARAVLLAFFGWAWEGGQVSGDDLLAIRAVRLAGVEWTGSARPQPYTGRELRALQARMDERWPRLAPDEARYWLARWAEGRSPYSRVRSHAIRCQLDAVIALALRCGLRRREVFALDVDAMHYDNAYVVVWRDGIKGSADARTVPYTASARATIAEWLSVRAILTPNHDRPWLNLWSAESARDPLRRGTFDRLLGTYVAEGCTLRRLRDTCAVTWARAALPPEHLCLMLGLSSLAATLPYLGAVGNDVEGSMRRHESAFSRALDGEPVAA